MTDFKNGSVKVSNDIIDQLIAESALQVDGIIHVFGYKNGKVDKNKKDGIVSVVNDNSIEIAISVVVEKDKNIQKVAENAQTVISEQIHTMLGFKVEEVNVFVRDLV